MRAAPFVAGQWKSRNLTVTGDATLNAATDGGGRLAVEVAGPAPLLISRLSVNESIEFRRVGSRYADTERPQSSASP